MKVKRDLLIKLGIQETISGFSYQRGDHVYLEEDCDAEKLTKLLDEKSIKYTLKSYHTNNASRVRGYDRYSTIPPIKNNYLSLLKAMNEWLDLNEQSKFAKSMNDIARVFRYNSQYSKKPDSKELKKYAKWVTTVLNFK